MARAVQLELFYSKRQILEAYLNDAPYGRNVEGVGAASLAYFDKPVAGLTLPEALTLAVLPQDPVRQLTWQGRRSGIISRLGASRDRLYRSWLDGHPQDESLRPLFALPMTIRPLSAPLPVRGAACGGAGSWPPAAVPAAATPASSPPSTWSCSTYWNGQITRYVARNRDSGIVNASGHSGRHPRHGDQGAGRIGELFRPHASGPGQRHVGAPFARLDAETFYLCAGVRSGGAASQDRAARCPHCLRALHAGEFRRPVPGPITATDALNRSRNIPAVWVASQLHRPDLYQFLQSAGIGNLQSEEHYGLALVLGGGEISMQEMAGLYAMLANQRQC